MRIVRICNDRSFCALHNGADRGTVNLYSMDCVFRPKTQTDSKARHGHVIESG